MKIVVTFFIALISSNIYGQFVPHQFTNKTKNDIVGSAFTDGNSIIRLDSSGIVTYIGTSLQIKEDDILSWNIIKDNEITFYYQDKNKNPVIYPMVYNEYGLFFKTKTKGYISLMYIKNIIFAEW